MYRDLADYYLRWYHDRPIGISPDRRDELRRLHRILLRACKHFAANWETLVPRYMPLSDQEMDILSEQSRYPFRAGTFRPDYLVTAKGDLVLCEITSRFFAHGIFMEWFADYANRRFCGDTPCESRFGAMMDYMRALPGGKKRIFIFKSADRTSEIRLYKRFYEALGIEVNILEADAVEPLLPDWSRGDALLISALNQRDLLGYRMETLRAMMRLGIVSDLRTVFLLHDKRFMHLWFEDAFTGAFLSPEETAFLRHHAIPTFLSPPADAREHKDKYILKPAALGKSEGVKAGVLTSEDEWKRLFDSGMAETMIAQPFLEQRTVPTIWEGTPFRDYLCGMMLCVDDEYFDSGHFRCSSLPVTNVGDDRKAAALHTGDPGLLSRCDLL